MSSTDFEVADLKAFIIQANKPHAEGTADVVSEADGSRTITYSDGDFRMHDNFFGGEPYGGRLVIFYKNKPVFIEVYYGQTRQPVAAVYDFLRTALAHPDELNPFRGPAEFRQGVFTYKSETTGDVSHHEVKEYIYKNDQEIYSATVIGGLVDQRADGAM